MKIWKLISVLLLACMVGACDDDPAGEELNGGASVNTVKQAKASFSYESKTVLKNAGVVLVPIRLETPVSQPVKITFSAQQSVGSNIAREGIDFNILEKVVTVAAGDTIGLLNVALLDNAKAEEDRVVVLNMTGVYNGEVSGVKTCSLHIVNNAFVEFQYKNRETYEAAGTYKIPLLVTGEIKETTTFTVRVKEGGTALEGTHFTLPETSFTLEKGATSADVEIQLIDDTQANEDRWFDLEITSVSGSNATVGKSISICRVTIISEEVFKFVAFGATSFTVEEGKTLRIPVALDKAPKSGEPNVLVTFSVKIANSTAVEGEDFTIVEKQLTFVPGQKEEELVIETIDNTIQNKNKVIELSIKAADGANIATPDVCQVSILDNEPILEQATYTVEEDYGEYVVPVSLPNTLLSDMTLKIKVVAVENVTEGEHYTLGTNEITIPKGENTGNIKLNIGFSLDWVGTPAFKVIIEEANEVLLGTDECYAAKISLKQCTYRKICGTYTWAQTYNGGSSYSGITVSTAGLKENFNKKFICTGKMWATSTGTTCYIYYDYDKTSKAIQVQLQKRICDGTLNFTAEGTNHILLSSYSNKSATSYPVTYDKNFSVLTWDTTDYLALELEETRGHYWMFLQNVTMTRKN